MRVPSQRITIRSVAARAGVSHSAVSLAFNNKPGISAATRNRIFQAAGELGWVPNAYARQLSSRGQVNAVGLVICRPARLLGLESFLMEFISGIESVLDERSCALLLNLVRDLDEEIAQQENWWRARQICGSILVDFRQNDPRVPVLRALGLPAVAVGHPSLTGGLTSVWTDDAVAAAEAVRYVAALGHRRIARVGGPAGLGYSAILTEPFAAAARDFGLTGDVHVTTGFEGEESARVTRSLMLGQDRPSAILYDNDVMAFAGATAAAELGLSVPDDLSLLALGDSQLCQLAAPPLSAVSHDVHGFGADVARTLFAVIDGEAPESHKGPTPFLTPRGSTAPLRK